MGASTEAVIAALSVIGLSPVWKSTFERASTIMVTGVFGFFALSWFDLAPLTYVWAAPLAAALMRWVTWLGSAESLEHVRLNAFRKALVSSLWLVVRTAGYVTVSSLVFTVIWPLVAPDTFWYGPIVSTVAGVISLPFEFVLLARGKGENIVASQKLALTAEESVLAAESEPGGGTIDESTVSPEDLDAQLAYRYQRAREEAEAEVRRYLPTNPRTAKRMVNHVSLAMTIAEQRGLFRDSALTQQHLAKWVGLSEQWPALGAALTTTPERMADLEQAVTLAELQEILDDLTPGTTASDEMRRRLQEGVPLSRLLDKLVRFEAG